MRFDRKSVQIINAGTPKVAFSTCTQALSTDSQYHTLAASGAIHKDYGSFRVQGSTGGIQHTKARGFGILTDSFANEGFNKETHRLLHVEGSCGTTNTDLVPVLSVGFMDPTTSDTSVATGVKSTFDKLLAVMPATIVLRLGTKLLHFKLLTQPALLISTLVKSSLVCLS